MRVYLFVLLFSIMGCNVVTTDNGDCIYHDCIVIEDTINTESSAIPFELKLPWNADSIYDSFFTGCTYAIPVKVINRKGYSLPCLKGGFDFCKIADLDSFCNIQLSWEEFNDRIHPINEEITIMKKNLRLTSLVTKNKKDTFDLITEKWINGSSGIYSVLVDTTILNQSTIKYSYSQKYLNQWVAITCNYFGEFDESILSDFEFVIHTFVLKK